MHQVKQGHFRRFSPPLQGCCSGVSARSRPCFGRVNPLSARAADRGEGSERPESTAVHRYHLPFAMTDAHVSPSPGASSDHLRARPASLSDDARGRVGTLRGATVQFDSGRLVQVFLGVVLGTLAVLVVVFAFAGIHSNDQIDRLHSQGERVTVSVTGCLGLLGGSGSNAAGYSCRGTYMLGGQSHEEPLPGSTFYRPGTRIPALAVPGDPALVSPLAVVDMQQSSASVFILPGVLAAVLVAMVALIVWRYRVARGAAAARGYDPH